jgi:predicted nucleic acid-binding protein
VICYLDTSAAMKLLVEEDQSAALVSYLQSESGRRPLVSSWLLHTDLHCAANRHPDGIDLGSVGVVLDTVTLLDLTRGDLLTAGTLPGRLRSGDAMHLATALRAGADELVTYDIELAAAADAAGIAVTQPHCGSAAAAGCGGPLAGRESIGPQQRPLQPAETGWSAMTLGSVPAGQ